MTDIKKNAPKDNIKYMSIGIAVVVSSIYGFMCFFYHILSFILEYIKPL